MSKQFNSIKTIGILLALCYLLSLWTLGKENTLLMPIFLGLAIGAAGVIGLKSWGRTVILGLSTVLLVYFGFLLIVKSVMNVVVVSHMIFNLVVILFFMRPRSTLALTSPMVMNRKSILIIDDDPGLLKTIKPMLLAKGFSVLTATTGEKGLYIAKVQKPDVIILDVILPGVKGRDVCRQIKDDAVTKDIPVIFLTAKDSPDDIEAELAAGGFSHITKPVTTQSLLEEVKKALG
jgi:CheY-like chemotaxis protein